MKSILSFLALVCALCGYAKAQVQENWRYDVQLQEKNIEVLCSETYEVGNKLYVAGRLKEGPSGSNDVVLLVYDQESGELSRTFTSGKSFDDAFVDLLITQDQKLMALGYINVTQPDGKNIYEVFLAKFTPEGENEWEKYYGTAFDKKPSAFSQLPNGNILITANTYNDQNEEVVAMTLLDSEGLILKESTLPLNGQKAKVCCMSQCFNDEVFLTGQIFENGARSSNTWLAKINTQTLELIWSKDYGTLAMFDQGQSLCAMPDGHVYLAANSTIAFRDVDIMLYKLSNDGVVIWQKNLGDSYADHINSLRLTSYRTLLVAGKLGNSQSSRAYLAEVNIENGSLLREISLQEDWLNLKNCQLDDTHLYIMGQSSLSSSTQMCALPFHNGSDHYVKPDFTWITQSKAVLSDSRIVLEACASLKPAGSYFELVDVDEQNHYIAQRGQFVVEEKNNCKFAFTHTVNLKHGQNNFKLLLRSINTKEIIAESSLLSIYHKPGAQELEVNKGKRQAVIIANSNYVSMNFLKNPRNDAEDMKAALEKNGYEVLIFQDLSLEKFKECLRSSSDFIKQTRPENCLFFYAGHSLQHNGQTYFMPTDMANNSTSQDLKQLVSLDQVAESMSFAGSRIMIIDGCRNNPLASTLKQDGSRPGVNAPANTIIAFATAPGQPASDGAGRNGLYTSHLLQHIHSKQSIEDVLKNTRNGVIKDSYNQQVPWETSSLEINFIIAR